MRQSKAILLNCLQHNIFILTRFACDKLQSVSKLTDRSQCYLLIRTEMLHQRQRLSVVSDCFVARTWHVEGNDEGSMH